VECGLGDAAWAGSLVPNRRGRKRSPCCHNFTGGVDGALPSGGVVFDAAGNLYGTTAEGGYTGGACADYGCGAVFKLKAGADGWTLNPLYNFHFNDGNLPIARVVFGPDGTLYGTTFNGGTSGEYGTVFNLRPPPTVCKTRFCPWTETVLLELHRSS